jgi:hypothetical protein
MKTNEHDCVPIKLHLIKPSCGRIHLTACGWRKETFLSASFSTWPNRFLPLGHKSFPILFSSLKELTELVGKLTGEKG